MTKHMTRVLVANLQFLVSAGIVDILQHNIGITKAFIANDFKHVCALLEAGPPYTMITLDPSLPEMNGLAGIRFLRTRYPALHIVIVSDQADQEAILSALAAGIHGYILADMSAAAIVDAFKLVLEGKIFVPRCVSETHACTQPPQTIAVDQHDVVLTHRQLDVILNLRKGYSNKEIARALNISESTVKVHMAAAFRQLGVHNRVGIISVLDEKMRSRTRSTHPDWTDRRRVAIDV